MTSGKKGRKIYLCGFETFTSFGKENVFLHMSYMTLNKSCKFFQFVVTQKFERKEINRSH